MEGDKIGGFVFKEPLVIGQKIIFYDMAHYTMVKTTMFNGVDHPSKAVIRTGGEVEILKEFTYEDYKSRM